MRARQILPDPEAIEAQFERERSEDERVGGWPLLPRSFCWWRFVLLAGSCRVLQTNLRRPIQAIPPQIRHRAVRRDNPTQPETPLDHTGSDLLARPGVDESDQ